MAKKRTNNLFLQKSMTYLQHLLTLPTLLQYLDLDSKHSGPRQRPRPGRRRDFGVTRPRRNRDKTETLKNVSRDMSRGIPFRFGNFGFGLSPAVTRETYLRPKLRESNCYLGHLEVHKGRVQDGLWKAIKNKVFCAGLTLYSSRLTLDRKY